MEMKFVNKLFFNILMIIFFLFTFAININSIYAKKFNMSYIYFGDLQSNIQQVDKTKGSLQVVSPSYFDINQDGTLKITSSLNKYFIQEMKKRNIKVVPFLSNHWDRNLGKKALQNRQVLVQQIAKAIQEYDLDGINVDIENVTEKEKEQYTDLLRLLREAIPRNKEVSVAVAANPERWNTGWHGSYDYKELAKYSDYLMIMAYDESYYGGPEGPVASISFVEKSILYALEHTTADKIVLGIPLYGRSWRDGVDIGGTGFHLTQIEEMIKRYNGNIFFDENYKSPKAVFTIRPQDIKTYSFGKPLPSGKYTIWYENEESIKHKLRLVQKYNLKGTGSWSLGQENPVIWNSYDLWLNGGFFKDIENHWAQEAILLMEQKEWMKGTSTLYFSPDLALTRAQAAVIFARIFNLDSIDIEKKEFYDVPLSYWAKKEIDLVQAHGIMLGTRNNEFSPEKPLTREEMAIVLNRVLVMEEEEVKGNDVFQDVLPQRWSYEAIKKMSNKNIFKGYEDKTFKPTQKLTRAEMSTLLYRLLKENILF